MANDATVKFGYDGTALNRGLSQQEGKLKAFASGTERSFRRPQAAIGALGLGLSQQEGKLKAFASGTERSFRGAQAAIGALGLGILAREGVQVVATFDRMQRGMTTLEGSASGAKQRMEELREASKMPGLDFEQAVQGDIRLRSVGVSAELSKKALVEMGNALSLAGGTSADLDGVVLALTQIISKGKVSAEEINQIAERVPQVRAVMKDMFGTADTETLQKMNIDAETFVSTLVEGFGKLERAQAGLDEKMNDFSTSIRGAANALLEGLVGKGAEGLSRLGGLLDANNDKLREAGQWLGNSASGVADWFVNAGEAIGWMAADLERALGLMNDPDGLAKYEAETQAVIELMQSQKDSIELEKIRTAEIKAAGEARKEEVKSLELSKPPEDPITAAAKAMNQPASKEQQALDERKRKMAEAELPIKEQIAAVEERIAEQQAIVANAAVTLNLTAKDRIANEMKLLDLQEQAAGLKRREDQRQGIPASTATTTGAVRVPPSSRSLTETRGSFMPPTPEAGYDAEGRRLTDGRSKIRGVQTPDTYTGGSLVTGDRRLSGPFRPLTAGGGLSGHYARQRGGMSTSGASASAAIAPRGDDVGAKLDRTNELLSKVLLGN